MKHKYLLGTLVAAAVAAGAIGLTTALSSPTGTAYPYSSSAPGTGTATGPGVRTATLPAGTALVDGSGRALYLFEADTGTTSTCNGVCAAVWPPLLTGLPVPAPAGAAEAQLLGATTRSDGSRQVTYNGHPLYYFAGDRAAGDARGQGLDQFGGTWYLVAPNGNEIDAGHAPAPAAGATGY